MTTKPVIQTGMAKTGGEGSLDALGYRLRLVTEAAALAAHGGLGDHADQRGAMTNAIQAMQVGLSDLNLDATVVIGTGDHEDNEAVLKPGGRFGPGIGFDMALDPAEGLSYLADGMTNAMTVVGLADREALYQPGPAFYMEKFVCPPEAAGCIDAEAPVASRLQSLAECLNKPVGDVVVFVLEKPRHRKLVAEIEGAGAQAALYPAGDIAGAIAAATPGSGIDALMGTGGASEGVISAIGVRALGGEMFASLDPQLNSERMALKQAGLSPGIWRTLDDLVKPGPVVFVATGISTGLLFSGVSNDRGTAVTETMILGSDGLRQMITTHHAS